MLLTKKRLYKLKSLLNLVFEYACDKEQNYISVNPVPVSNAAVVKHCRPAKCRPEEKAFQPDDIQKIKNYVWEQIDSKPYSPNYYAILLAIETGMREAELPSLKWEDISDLRIHIHSQQLDEKKDSNKIYYYAPYTKNERGVELGGRYFPITENIRIIFNRLSEQQKELGIHSEYVFAKADSNWTNTKSYNRMLHSVATKLELKITNNHAFRIALNSYVFVPMGLEAPERARLLGHSVETNLKHYTFSRDDEFIDEIREKLNDFAGVPRGTSKIIKFKAKKRSLKTANFQASSN